MPFKPGNVANPKGRPSGKQGFVDRCKYLCETYDIGQVREIVTNKAKFQKISPYDGIILMRLYEAFQEGGKDSANMLLDRLIGKPKQELQVDSTVQVNMVLQSAVQEIKQLDENALQQISAVLEANIIECEYTEIEPSE